MTLYFIARPDKGIDSLDDIRGMRVVTGPNEMPLLLQWEQATGIDIVPVEIPVPAGSTYLKELVAYSNTIAYYAYGGNGGSQHVEVLFLDDRFNSSTEPHVNPATEIAFLNRVPVLTDGGDLFVGYPDQEDPEPEEYAYVLVSPEPLGNIYDLQGARVAAEDGVFNPISTLPIMLQSQSYGLGISIIEEYFDFERRGDPDQGLFSRIELIQDGRADIAYYGDAANLDAVPDNWFAYRVTGTLGVGAPSFAAVELAPEPEEPDTPVEVPYDPSDFQIVIRKSFGIDDISELSGVSLIMYDGSLTEQKVADYFRANGIEYSPVLFTSDDEMIAALAGGRGDALAVRFGGRALEMLDNPEQYEIIDPSPTPSHVSDVALLYEAGLGRTADVGGLNYWIDVVEGGTSLEQLADYFLESNEFTSRFGDDDGLTNTQFVDVMYQNVLDRAGESVGLDFWINTMNAGMSREQVLIAFAVSQENKDASSIDFLYQTSPGEWEFV